MAEPLKHQYGPEIPHRIAAMIAAVRPAFDAAAFTAEALQGYDALELMPRGRHLAQVLRRHLPADYAQAIDWLLASLGPVAERTEGGGMAPFLYLPHVMFVAGFGLEHFEVSMQAQHALTQRFTAEFSIRPFLERHPEATLAQLQLWAGDPSEHVRRLVSEGTRPRLPWASRLAMFQRDPAPVLALLERLKDDASPYVRRSVANNLNDIGKDHPAVLIEVARRWWPGASPERQALLRHALRSRLKAGDADALALLGAGGAADVQVGDVTFVPRRPQIGARLVVGLTLQGRAAQVQRVRADLRVHFVKAGGGTSAKVFVLRTLDLVPGEPVRLSKTIALGDLTTRRHYPGLHRIELVLNGMVQPLGAFELLPA